MSVKRYVKQEGNREIQVQIINQDIENASWLVVYRFGDIEREEYFNDEEEAYKMAAWVPWYGYKLIKLSPIELL